LVSSRLLGLRESMLQFMAGSREYEAVLGRKMEMENVGLKDFVATHVSTVSSVR
jgi:hypothetical protein